MRGQSTPGVNKKKKVTSFIKLFESFEMRYHMPYLLHHPKIPYWGLGLSLIHSKGILGWWSRYGKWYLISKLSKSFYSESCLLFLVHHWGRLTSHLRVVSLSCSTHFKSIFLRNFPFWSKNVSLCSRLRHLPKLHTLHISKSQLENMNTEKTQGFKGKILHDSSPEYLNVSGLWLQS